MIIVDDHILLELLLDRPPAAIEDHVRTIFSQPIYTTGCWYYRLCRALTDVSRSGSLSGQIADQPVAIQQDIVRMVRTLPPTVQIAPMRDVAPVMADLSIKHRLNLLNLEILATAVMLGASIYVATGNEAPTLEAAAKDEGITITSVSL